MHLPLVMTELQNKIINKSIVGCGNANHSFVIIMVVHCVVVCVHVRSMGSPQYIEGQNYI